VLSPAARAKLLLNVVVDGVLEYFVQPCRYLLLEATRSRDLTRHSLSLGLSVLQRLSRDTTQPDVPVHDQYRSSYTGYKNTFALGILAVFDCNKQPAMRRL
jgi:hypothetical protein